MVVLDASATLAELLEEAGADVVATQMVGAEVSIVNICEVQTKSAEQGGDVDEVRCVLGGYALRVRAFREIHAEAAARLRPLTRHLGLSPGDRACLAQAQISCLPVLTADRLWGELDIGLDIRLIR